MWIGLHEAVRATCYGIEISVPNIFAIFWLYCPASGTFFTPVGELELALHEMWEISNLPMGSMSYGEYCPCIIELEQIEKDNLGMFETHQELMCYFYICMDIHNTHRNSKGYRSGQIICSQFCTVPRKTSNSRFQMMISTRR